MGHQCMTQAEYARYSGLCKSYISRLVNAGVIPLNRDGRIDPQAADQARRQRVRPRVRALKKGQRMHPTAPQPPMDHIDLTVEDLLDTIARKTRHITQFAFVERYDDAQLRDFLVWAVRDFLNQWKKSGNQ